MGPGNLPNDSFIPFPLPVREGERDGDIFL
jgi:hypothetical protein